MDYKEGKTEWDLRQSLTEMIAKFTTETQLKYRDALHNPDYQNLRNYFLELKNLFRLVKRYADSEGDHKEDVESISEKLDNLSRNFSQDGGLEFVEDSYSILEDLEELDDEVQALRMDVGLDIPREKDYDPEDAGLAGLK